MLWNKDPNIIHVESHWNLDKMKEFQTTIQRFSEDIYDSALRVSSVTHEEALCVSQGAVNFQKILFKAACLQEEDFSESRLFLRVKGNGGPSGNNMNAPWDRLLSTNPNFVSYTYELNSDRWDVLTTEGVSKLDRINLGGVETIIYRIITRLMRHLPSRIFSGEVLIPNENELVIETAAKLALHGVKITEIEPSGTLNKQFIKHDRAELIRSILPVVGARIKKWVVSPAISPCENIFIEDIDKRLSLFDNSVVRWGSLILEKIHKNRVVLTNSPGNIRGQSLSVVCNALNIPIVSAQHGITAGINALHGEVSVGLENSVSDCVLTYNKKIDEIENNSHFSKAKSFVVGISSRHIRMQNGIGNKANTIPIVYISTNLYKGNLGLFTSWQTDYESARREHKIITNVLSKLPYRVRYKTYPNDNRRYADADPVLDSELGSNIELFDSKVDMRYLLAEHSVIVTSVATSTLSWPVMSGKPVVFINQRDNGPLTNDAYVSLSKGIFVFNDHDKNFYLNLREFLSQSIDVIEELWQEKKVAREAMIKEYFSGYGNGAGGRAAEIILREYL
jgi:hypothetical protein